MGELKYRKDKSGQFQAYIGKKKYLLDMRGRLEDEIYPLLRCCWEIAGKRQIGFWAMIRLLMPVVETAGGVVYPEAKNPGSMVLREMGVPYPEIAWRLFRHNLLHGDELVQVIHDESEQHAGWSISFGGGHTREHLKVCIDVDQLYYDLLGFLEEKSKNVPEHEEVELRAVRISDQEQAKNESLRIEVEELFGLRKPVSHAVRIEA